MMHFWEYLKKQESSEEYEKAKNRISEIHNGRDSLSYINQMYPIKDDTGEMLVEFVKGKHLVNQEGKIYDCNGEISGKIIIKEILVGENEDRVKWSETGENGKIIFCYEEPVNANFWRAQYLLTKKIKKIEKNC
ncbi:hypothetical protein [Anaerostipes sp.]|uniref:hypothetical protein n=3 Tax=Lachnospiraceae TaxID=186803 RepID=UPI00258B00B1|nr:hypothetical protein [Anaerostipes sp.]MCI5623690.1 hypothetical protein [Anaerostipes sp.]